MLFGLAVSPHTRARRAQCSSAISNIIVTRYTILLPKNSGFRDLYAGFSETSPRGFHSPTPRAGAAKAKKKPIRSGKVGDLPFQYR